MHPQYLIDIIELHKQQEKKESLSGLFERDPRFREVIPHIVLREKLQEIPNDDAFFEEKEELLIQLAREYHDSDAVLSIMMLQFGRKNYKKSSIIANIVLDNEKENQGLRYYLALYFQIYYNYSYKFCIFYLCFLLNYNLYSQSFSFSHDNKF